VEVCSIRLHCAIMPTPPEHLCDAISVSDASDVEMVCESLDLTQWSSRDPFHGVEVEHACGAWEPLPPVVPGCTPDDLFDLERYVYIYVCSYSSYI